MHFSTVKQPVFDGLLPTYHFKARHLSLSLKAACGPNVLAKFQVSQARPKAHTLKDTNTYTRPMQLRSMQLNWLISKQSAARYFGGRGRRWSPGREPFLWPAKTFSRGVSPSAASSIGPILKSSKCQSAALGD